MVRNFSYKLLANPNGLKWAKRHFSMQYRLKMGVAFDTKQMHSPLKRQQKSLEI